MKIFYILCDSGLVERKNNGWNCKRSCYIVWKLELYHDIAGCHYLLEDLAANIYIFSNLLTSTYNFKIADQAQYTDAMLN